MCFIIQDPVQREVFAASFRDRIVHHLIYNYISPVLEKKFVFDSYSCRAGKGTLAGIVRLEHHIRSCSNNFTRPAYILKSAIVSIRRFLDRVLHLALHPNKIYLQNVRNGVSFVGAFIKPYRRYVSHRTAKAFSVRFSVIPDTETASEIRAVLNSYLGNLSHFASYHFRRRFIWTHPWLYLYGWFPVNYGKMQIAYKCSF